MKKPKLSIREELELAIEEVRLLVTPVWQKGGLTNRSTSICMEVNIDVAKDALETGNPRQMKSMLSTMNFYIETEGEPAPQE